MANIELFYKISTFDRGTWRKVETVTAAIQLLRSWGVSRIQEAFVQTYVHDNDMMLRYKGAWTREAKAFMRRKPLYCGSTWDLPDEAHTSYDLYSEQEWLRDLGLRDDQRRELTGCASVAAEGEVAAAWVTYSGDLKRSMLWHPILEIVNRPASAGLVYSKKNPYYRQIPGDYLEIKEK